MEITEIRIKLVDEPGERLQAFCSITFDDAFVVRDLKIIGGTNGPFVAMPSRKLTGRCRRCSCKNHLRAAYCNQCGTRLEGDRIKDVGGRAKLYADIAHPINTDCRELIQRRIIEAYTEEIERAQQPGYVCRYDDPDEEPAANFPRAHHPSHEEPADHAARAGEEIAPRGPHKRPSSGSDARRDHEEGASGEFGAGIF